MNQKDLVNQITFSAAIPAQTINSNATTASSAIDMQGAEGAVFLLHAGAIDGGTANNVYTILLTECDTSGGSYTTVADTDTINLQSATVLNGVTDNSVAKIGYIGHKRYVKASIVSTGFTTAGGIVALSSVGRWPASRRCFS